MGYSVIDLLARLSPEDRAAYINTLSVEEMDAIFRRDWSVVARPEQLQPDGDWMIWLLRAGRGFGKSLTGAQWTRQRIRWLTPHVDRGKVRWALGAPKRADVKKVMIEGQTGLLSVFPEKELWKGKVDLAYNRSELELKLASGAIITGYSSENPESPRGPQHHGGWVDEPASLKDAKDGLSEDTFMSNLLLGMRLPPDPRMVITGTPKNVKLIKELRALPGVREVTGRTKDNLHNLSATFKATVYDRYINTRLGKQELDAEILDDLGTLMSPSWFIPRDAPPWGSDRQRMVERYWDLASGTPSDSNPDPDWTVGAKVLFDPDSKLYFIADICRFRKGPGEREIAIGQVARGDLVDDGLGHQWIEKEPGNAGLVQLQTVGAETERHGVGVFGRPATGSKLVKSEVLQTAAQQRRVFVLADAPWLQDFLDEIEEYPNGSHDDQVDAVSGAMATLLGPGYLEGSSADLYG